MRTGKAEVEPVAARDEGGAMTLAMAVTLGWSMFLLEIVLLVGWLARHHR